MLASNLGITLSVLNNAALLRGGGGRRSNGQDAVWTPSFLAGKPALLFLLFSLRGMGWSGGVLWKPHSSDGKGIAKLHTYLVLDDATEFSFSRQQKRSPVKELFVLRFVLFLLLCMLCVWVYILCMYVQCMFRFLLEVLDSLELKFQAIVSCLTCVLGTALGSFARAGWTLNS